MIAAPSAYFCSHENSAARFIASSFHRFPSCRRAPTNATEAAQIKAAEEKASDDKFQQWKATLSPEQQAWESVLEANLGNGFYLPLYKKDKVRGSVSAWDYVKDDPKTAPRVLLILAIPFPAATCLAARKALAGKANVHRAPEKLRPTG